MALSFACDKSAFLCSLINTRVLVVTYTHRVNAYFNDRYMAVIAYVIRPGKTEVFSKIYFIHGYITASVVFIQSCYRWLGLPFLIMDFQASISPSHVTLLIGFSFVQLYDMMHHMTISLAHVQHPKVILLGIITHHSPYYVFNS